MRPSLALQRSLYRFQLKQLEQSVAQPSPAFRRYEARYRRATRTWSRALAMPRVHARIAAADVVYVGDYHTLRAAQQAYLRVVTQALRGPRRVVLALEFVEHRHQHTLERFLAGRLAERAFLTRIGHPYRSGFDIWPSFLPIFELARSRGLEVIGIDHRAAGARSLQARDEIAARLIAQASRAEDTPLVLVLVGQYHVAPAHLPRRVRAALGDAQREHLTIYQNAEGIYWALANRGLADRHEAVEIDEAQLCLITASPVACQRSFLDYVEAERGDAPVEESGVQGAFHHLARAIGRLTGTRVGAALSELAIVTADQLDVVERRFSRGRFSKQELAALRRHLRTRESAYIPRARLVWLASLSLNHVAEEAAHFVRHVAVGAAMDRPRPRVDSFWARCLEEALGFFGSKLVNPARRCVGAEEWTELFRGGKSQTRTEAAFVLALLSVVQQGTSVPRELLPVGSPTLFNTVSHALGYLLGERLFRAFEVGALNAHAVSALFRDPHDDPESAWRHLWTTTRPAPAERSRRRAAASRALVKRVAA
jgi:hypothetical protein